MPVNLAFLRAIVLAMLGVVGCSAPDPLTTLGMQAAIIEGQLAVGTDDVVMVSGASEVAGCTGTIVAERAVVTAKHCVQLPDALEPSDPSTLRVGVGRTLHSGSGLKWGNVESVHVVPGVYSAAEPEALFGSDLAVLILREATSIPPRRIRFAAVEELVGTTAQAIGYGLTPEGESGTRYRVATVITSITERSLAVEGAVCQGDSGGPLIDAQGALVGVVSVGEGLGCSGGTSFFERVDTHREFVLSTVAASGGCVLEGDENCDGHDNDCDGEVDLACADLGDPCAEDRECQPGQRCTAQLCVATRPPPEEAADSGEPGLGGSMLDPKEVESGATGFDTRETTNTCSFDVLAGGAERSGACGALWIGLLIVCGLGFRRVRHARVRLPPES
jgi:V8-like Glu-specific endopeptidase